MILINIYILLLIIMIQINSIYLFNILYSIVPSIDLIVILFSISIISIPFIMIHLSSKKLGDAAIKGATYIGAAAGTVN